MSRMIARIVVALCLLPTRVQAVIPSVIVEGPLPATEGNRPWNASIDRIQPLDVAALGYIEEEYFISGRANVYDWDQNGRPAIKAEGAQYVTRILIRKPKDRTSSSGTVWINPSNPTLGVDMDGLWGCCSSFLSHRGDVVVNITFKPASMRAMKAVNPQRYERLSMPDPISAEKRCDLNAIPKLDVSVQYIEGQEDGLAWDIFTQVAYLIKNGKSESPLSGYKVSRVYGFGYSQDANYLRTYLNDFQNNALSIYGEAGMYDGFLLAAGTRTVPINQCSTRARDTRVKSGGVPVITASTEADANPKLPGLPDGRSAWRPDSNKPNDRYRHYDIAGAVHLGSSVYRTMPRLDVVGRLRDISPRAVHAIEQVSSGMAENYATPEVQQYDFLTAMMENLDTWSRTGRSPPPGSRFKLGPDGNIGLDSNGNAASGLRSPDITVPLGTFTLRGPASVPLGFLNYSYTPFPQEKLRNLYPTHASYMRKVQKEADKLLRARLITEQAHEEILRKAESRAALFFIGPRPHRE